jgi:ribosomal protein S18 acetylase RimI-like enzyme
VCRRLRADGARRIGLEVEVDNEHALGLYTSLGFERVSTEDYFRLP